MKKSIVFLILILLMVGFWGCSRTTTITDDLDFQPRDVDDEDLIAVTSQELDLFFVKEGFREQIAEHLQIENPSANRWVIALEVDRKDMMNLQVATVPTIKMRRVPYKIGDRGFYKGRKCTGNSPAVEGHCIRRPGGVNKWYRRDIIGYSFCRRSKNPKDICDVIYVNTGVWVFFSDRCRTISRRSNWHRPRWVCLP